MSIDPSIESPCPGEHLPGRSSAHASPFGAKAVGQALRVGWRVFRAVPGPSIALGSGVAALGVAFAAALVLAGASPLLLVLAGGFLLIAPALLAGYFALFRCHERGEAAGIGTVLEGFAGAGGGFWVLVGLCSFLFLVWVTDAGVLYAFTVGEGPLLEPRGTPDTWPRLARGAWQFALWSLPLGAVIALAVYAVTAFSLPLAFERRAQVVAGVQSSIAAVFANPVGALTWGLVVATGTWLGMLLLPLLPVVLPVLAYGGFALYRSVFPPAADADQKDRPCGP